MSCGSPCLRWVVAVGFISLLAACSSMTPSASIPLSRDQWIRNYGGGGYVGGRHLLQEHGGTGPQNQGPSEALLW
jgi:hypothetical protein